MLRFGTDGVRGDAATLTPELAAVLGQAAATVLGGDRPFVIGRDTRESGARIERDVTAGIHAGGGTAVSLGVAPTPAVAFTSQRRGAPGVVISASHNRFSDNGIKLFAPGGVKLSDAEQQAIEHAMAHSNAQLGTRASGTSDEIAIDDPAIDDRGRTAYVEHLTGALDGRRLDGLHIVLDVANGAAFAVAPDVFRALGATVDVLHDRPDGRNINEACGSTHPESLRAAVCARGAALGLAFDGDADRCIGVDERGEIIDGDEMMVALARDFASRDLLANNAVVVTVLSNFGLREALRGSSIDVVETPVGDRHVFAAMEAGGYVLGGEQSGHIIVRSHATTGDGVLAGVLLADLMLRRGVPASALAAPMVKLPQVARNVRVAGAPAIGDGLDAPAPAPWRDALRAAEAELAGTGRVLVRPSGTEPVVRVMVEAPTVAQAEALAERVAAAIPGGPDGSRLTGRA